MTDFYFRKEGKSYEAEKYFKEELTQNINILTITKKYIKENLQVMQPTEINYVMYPHLGEELFKDERIAMEEVEGEKNDYNNYGGVAIYIRDEEDQNMILKEEYRDLKIGYISIVEHYNIIENILSAIHELNHFKDPFNSSINYVKKFLSKGYEQDTIKFIQFNVRNILNEYYANYRAYEYLKTILIDLNIEQFDIEGILNQSFYNLQSSLTQFKDRLISLKEMEENYFRFSQYLTFFFRFFEIILKFLGKWHGLIQNNKEINPIFNKTWEHFKKKVEEASLEFTINFIDLIKSIITPTFKDKGNIIEIYNLFYIISSQYSLVIETL